MRTLFKIGMIPAVVGLVACTDYKTEINDAHEAFVNGNAGLPEGEPGSPDALGCKCNLTSSNVEYVSGTYYYEVGSDPDLTYGVVDCSDDVHDIDIDLHDYAVVKSRRLAYDGGRFILHYTLDKNVVEHSIDDAFSPEVGMLLESGDSEPLQCPTVYFKQKKSNPVVKSSSSFSSSSSSSSSSISSSSSFSSSSSNVSSSSSVPSSSGKVHPEMDLWDGASHEYRIITGLDENGSSGYWFAYTDNGNGMESTLDWPVDRGNSFSVDAFDPVIDYCGGLCGTVYLSRGASDATNDPYVGVGFNIAGSSGVQSIITDASSWGGLCITYASSVSILVMMDFGEAGNNEVGYDRPVVTLEPTSEETEVCYRWSEFEPRWQARVSGDEGSTRLGGINFEIYGPDGTNGEFNIIGLGRYR